jgi:hypothetical protein
VGFTNMIARHNRIIMGIMKYNEFIFFLSFFWIEIRFSVLSQKYHENKQKHYTIKDKSYIFHMYVWIVGRILKNQSFDKKTTSYL